MKNLNQLLAALAIGLFSSLGFAQGTVLFQNWPAFEKALVAEGHLKDGTFSANVLASTAYKIARERDQVVSTETEASFVEKWLKGHGLAVGEQITTARAQEKRFVLLPPTLASVLTAHAVSAASVDKELAELKAAVAKAGTKAQLTTLQGQLRELSEKLATLNTNRSTTSSQVEELKRQIGLLDVTIRTVGASHTALQSEDRKLKERLDSVENGWLERYGWYTILGTLAFVLITIFISWVLGMNTKRTRKEEVAGLKRDIGQAAASAGQASTSAGQAMGAAVNAGTAAEQAKAAAASAGGVAARAEEALAGIGRTVQAVQNEVVKAVTRTDTLADDIRLLKQFVGFRELVVPGDFAAQVVQLTEKNLDYEFDVFFQDDMTKKFKLGIEYRRPGYVSIHGLKDFIEEVDIRDVRETIGRVTRLEPHRLVGLPEVSPPTLHDSVVLPEAAAAVSLGGMAGDWVAPLTPTDHAPLTGLEPTSPGALGESDVAGDDAPIDVLSFDTIAEVAKAPAVTPEPAPVVDKVEVRPVVASAFPTLGDNTGNPPAFLLKINQPAEAT